MSRNVANTSRKPGNQSWTSLNHFGDLPARFAESPTQVDEVPILVGKAPNQFLTSEVENGGYRRWLCHCFIELL